MIFNKATLVSAMTSKDKRFGELSTAVQDSIIQDGINYTQDHIQWFRSYQDNLLTTMIGAGADTISTIYNPSGIQNIVFFKDIDDVPLYPDILVTKNRSDLHSVSLTFRDNVNYDDIIIRVVWFIYPDVNSEINTDNDIINLIKYASYMKMYEYFEDIDRESRNKHRFDELLGTSTINIIDEFQDIPMKNFN